MKSVLEMLKELMSCHAMTAEVSAVNQAVAVMKKYADEEGLYTQLEDFNGRHALYASTVPGKVADVLLNVHLDVVAVPSLDMFTPKVDEKGIVRGRGVSDDQGPAICVLKVLANLKGKASVGAIFTSDEEHGGFTTGGMVSRGYAGSKLALVIDGPSYGVAVAQKGIITMHLKAHGVSGHSSRPWNCQNALDTLIDGYLKLRQAWPQVTEADPWHNTMAATVCNAGDSTATNQIPNVAEMVLNIRYVCEEDYDKILQQARELTGLEVITSAHHCKPMFTDEKNPLIQNLLAAMRKAFPGKEITTIRMMGATDARHLADMGVPIGIIGLPGGDAHGPGEWLDLNGLDNYVDLLTDFIANIK